MCCFASPSKNQQRTRKQETKKLKKKQKPKKKIAHPKVGSSGRELGLVFLVSWFFLVFWILVAFSHCRKTNNEPENKKPKKLKKRNQKKIYIAHPKGGSSGRELGLVILFFVFFVFVFCFFGFGFLVSWFLGWFCLAIAEKPGKNSQWLQSSERTIAHVQCQWLQNAVKNRTPRVSPSEPSEKKRVRITRRTIY